ncbi:MAG: hypothetical protein JWO36_6303 [Myxococcales bacterium]|nr:hypothetical protein [Myxococcales bacterium]
MRWKATSVMKEKALLVLAWPKTRGAVLGNSEYPFWERDRHSEPNRTRGTVMDGDTACDQRRPTASCVSCGVARQASSVAAPNRWPSLPRSSRSKTKGFFPDRSVRVWRQRCGRCGQARTGTERRAAAVHHRPQRRHAFSSDEDSVDAGGARKRRKAMAEPSAADERRALVCVLVLMMLSASLSRCSISSRPRQEPPS